MIVFEEFKKIDFKRVMEFLIIYFVDKKGNFVGEKVVGVNSKEDWKKIIDERLKMVKVNE